jgi:hypothetical protein|tara:strand:+ start:163 stop:360 length:198 start_codon:yes stop_codon:yes gene_type:complete
MIGEYIIKIGDKLFEYTNTNDIPEKFDNLIKFMPTSPESPHTEEEHKEMATYNDKLKELMKREKN